ncbi:MAG: HIT domain-containing protein [Candidatus Diapherotrites archaeon]
MGDCVFCKIADRRIPSEKIYENDNFFSIPDANQQIEGHSLVISKKHFETFLDLPNTLGTELLDCIKKTVLKLIEKHKSEGFNIVNNNFECAGQVVKHFHLHILPRKKGGIVPRVY